MLPEEITDSGHRWFSPLEHPLSISLLSINPGSTRSINARSRDSPGVPLVNTGRGHPREPRSRRSIGPIPFPAPTMPTRDWLNEMDASQFTARRESFGFVAQAYAESRPEYPVDAVRWLVGAQGAEVVDLGAGTGKLTTALLADGHRVIAAEPSRSMLDQLVADLSDDDGRLPEGLRCVRTTAEQLPFADASIDAVVAAQAFHWFDAEKALAEIARVLRPRGAIGLIWNFRDESVPWVRRLSQVIGSEGIPGDPTEVLTASGLFDEVKQARFRMWQQVDRESLVSLVSSRSYVASRPRHERQEIFNRVRQLYDESARSPEGLILPYRTVCYRARVNALSRRRVDADSLFWG